MMKKLYKVTTAFEDKDGYSPNFDSYKVVAETAERAIKKLPKLDKDEFVDEVEVISELGIE